MNILIEYHMALSYQGRQCQSLMQRTGTRKVMHKFQVSVGAECLFEIANTSGELQIRRVVRHPDLERLT